MKKVERLEEPLNANERFLYAVAMRLDVLIEQVSAISEYLAKRDNVTIESNTTSTKVVKASTDSTKKEPVVKPTRTRKRG